MTYTDEVADLICTGLIEGRGLIAICRAPGMPPESTVRLWVADDRGGFAAKYARARDIGLDHQADEIIEIADNSELEPDDRRVKIEARKWHLSKIAPKRYGDRTDTNVNVNVRYVVVGETEALTDETWIEGTVDK